MLRNGRRSWTSMSIPTCRGPTWGPPRRPATCLCCRETQRDRCSADPACSSPQDAGSSRLLAGARGAGAPMCSRGPGPCPVPRPTGPSWADRPRGADDRTSDQGCQVPRQEEPGQLLQGDPEAQQDARCEWIERRENVIALGPSGTGKTHVALGLGLAACQKGMSVSFTTWPRHWSTS